METRRRVKVEILDVPGYKGKGLTSGVQESGTIEKKAGENELTWGIWRPAKRPSTPILRGSCKKMDFVGSTDEGQSIT